MIPTPRTDDIEDAWKRRACGSDYVMRKFREMEVELFQSDDAHDQMEMLANQINMELAAKVASLSAIVVLLKDEYERMEEKCNEDDGRQRYSSWAPACRKFQSFLCDVITIGEVGLRTETAATEGSTGAPTGTQEDHAAITQS